MSRFLSSSSSRFILIILFLNSIIAFAQEDYDIVDAYEDYTDAPREIVYLHLNKSTYVIGETLGFTAYVVNKSDKKPSLLTTNLYVNIEDKAQNIIKQKLIMINNGVASNSFEVDSSFSQGNYQIKAYTNWMRNFNEQNYFTETIKIKDLKIKEEDSQISSHKIDAQFLPESGHLLHGVENNIGVVIKDHLGFGIPFASGEVLDKNNNTLTTFKTNELGIGRFSLLADISNNYKINISANDKNLSFNLTETTEKDGVILSVKRLKQKVFVSLITNKNTLASIKNKRYSLLLHNGTTADLMDIYFTDHTEVTKVMELNGSPGINILTLFNENNQPIAERLVFNYQGIDILKSNDKPIISQLKDSLDIKLNYKSIDTTQFHNISVSVLPQDTKSYRSHHNVISYTYLQPYVKGTIENAKYYFTDITEKKKYELDNLLLTQGWSSYNWNTIFNTSPNLTYDFEQGIVVKANYAATNLNEKSRPNDLMYYFNDEGFMTTEANIDQKSYIIKRLFPEDDMNIKLSQVTENDGLKPANLYLQFFPRQIPTIQTYNASVLESKETTIAKKEVEVSSNIVFQPSEKVEKLEEVLIKSNPVLLQKERENALSRGRFGKLSVITEDDENTFITLLYYIAWKTQNWRPTGGPNINTSSVSGASNGNATNNAFLESSLSAGVNYFLNDMLLIETSRLDELFLSDVDYIEFNRFGVGDGLRSPGGFIKIYTKDPSRWAKQKDMAKAYEFPLTFSEQKKFYAPKYKYYDDNFYKHYGTIDWLPNLIVDANENITVKIAKPEVPITLFIEGIANDGSFIFEEKSIALNKTKK